MTKTGYTATGYWGTTPSGGTLIEQNANFTSYEDVCEKYGISLTTQSTTINIYAQWTANKIKLTLNQNGGSGGTTAVWYYYGTSTFYSNEACTTTITSITKPTKTGYNYEQYNGDGTSGGTANERYIYADGTFASDLATDIYKDATLTAVYADTTGPTLTITNPSNGNWTKDSITVTLTYSDAGSGINPATLAWSTDGSNFTAWTSNTNTSTKTDTWSNTSTSFLNGITGYYKVCDYAGNCTTKSTPINIDVSGPSLTITNKLPDGSTYTSGTWTNKTVNSVLTFSDSGSGVNPSSLVWSTNNSSWNATDVANTSTTTFTDQWVRDRNNTIYYKICDYSNNCTTKSFSLKIDTTSPTVTDVYLAQNLFPTKSPNATNGVSVSGTTYTATTGDPYLVFSGMNTSNVQRVIITLNSGMSASDTIQIFYATSGTNFSEANSVKVVPSSGTKVIEAVLPGGSYTALRVDLGTVSGLSAYSVSTATSSPSYTSITNTTSTYHVRFTPSSGTYYVYGKDATGNEAKSGGVTVSSTWNIGDTVYIIPPAVLYNSMSGLMAKDPAAGGTYDEWDNLGTGYTWSGTISAIYQKWTSISSVATNADPDTYGLYLNTIYRNGSYWSGGSYVRLDNASKTP